MFEVRFAKETEIPLLAHIEAQADTLFPADLIPAGDDPYPPELHLRACRTGCLLVACVGQEVVGFANAEPRARDYHLYLIAVLPAWGRRGIGRALLEQVMETAKQQGHHRLTLTTFSHLPWNAPFYKSVGFNSLAYPDCPPYLKEILNNEVAAGFKQRVAMVYDLSITESVSPLLK
ncbi:MAG: GNAT family N-acetyltransferase [Pseudomonadota bacterium]